MKKISLILLSFCLGSTLWAQHTSFGLKGGVNVATLKFANSDNNGIDSRIGLHVGGLAHIHLNPNWALQPEVVFSQEGAKIAVDNGEVTTKLDYVNIPVMLQYMFKGGFRLEAGPQLGLLVNSKYEDDDGIEGNADVDFKSTNVSLGLGLGYLSPTGLGFGARYNLGLSDISEAPSDRKGQNLQLSLFYQFGR
jgi:hypothetical protein